jgi:chromosome partitioning protein
MSKKQLFLNYKGGTGKTSVSSAYGNYLARMGKRVLMVDLDAQAHLTTCLDQEGKRHDKSLYSAILNGDDVSGLVVSTSLPNLKLIPSSISLSALEMPLFNMPLGELQLRKALRPLDRSFDFIIIDSAPNIGLLSLNAIIASDEILIPMLADFLSFHGLKILLETLAEIERDFQFYLGNVRVFLNRFNHDYEICREAKEAVAKFYPQYFLKTVIRESHEMIDASSLGKSIFDINPDSGVAQDIKDLVREVNGIR